MWCEISSFACLVATFAAQHTYISHLVAAGRSHGQHVPHTAPLLLAAAAFAALAGEIHARMAVALERFAVVLPVVAYLHASPRYIQIQAGYAVAAAGRYRIIAARAAEFHGTPRQVYIPS